MNATTAFALSATTEERSWLHSPDRTDFEYKPTYRWVENSTAKEERPKDIYPLIRDTFEAAKEEIFEEGMESNFSRRLASFVGKYGNEAVEVVVQLIAPPQGRVKGEVAYEALLCLGNIDDPLTYNFRRWLFEACLKSPSAWVRDGAALALASLDDPHAIPYLERAIEEEKVKHLRQGMKQVLSQLESTRRAIHLERDKPK